MGQQRCVSPTFLAHIVTAQDGERTRELERLESASDLTGGAPVAAATSGADEAALQLLAFLLDSTRPEAGGASLDACGLYL